MAVGVNVAGELHRAGDDEWCEAVDAVPSRSRTRVGQVPKVLRRLLIAGAATFVVGSCLAAWMLTVDASWIVGRTSDNPPAIGDSENLAGLPAVLSFTGGKVEGLPVQERSIALTFDDGPDPVFTEQILDVLNRHGVKATFFVLGANAVDNPGLLRQTVADGHELGIHTWNHPRLGALSPRHVDAQNRLTLTIVEGATGVSTTLARLPFTGDVRYLAPDETEAAHLVANAGYTVVMADIAPPDYRPGITAAEIVAAAQPPPGESAVIMMHDGGGDRSATVAAVDRLIPDLSEQGYQFVTVSEYAGLADAQPSAPLERRLAGIAVLNAARVVDLLAGALPGLLVVMGAMLIMRFILSIGLALWVYRRDAGKLIHLDHIRGVSVVVPAYNEAAGIEESLRSLLETRHTGPLEVVVVDDGSTDGTAEIVERLALPSVRLIRQANGGKASALNTGIEASLYEIVVLVDADTVFEPRTIERLLAPFADTRVGAVSGNPRVANPDRLVTKLQNAEYLLGCSLDRRMQAQVGIMWCVPGAVGAFRRSVLKDVGLVPTDTLAEDTDLTVAMRRRGWKVEFAPRANAYTEVPSTWKGLWHQRLRWSYGILQVNWKIRNHEADDTGWYRRFIGVYLLLTNLALPLIGPIVDVLGLISLTWMGLNRVVAVWLALSLVQVTAIWIAAALDGAPLRAALWGPAQIVVYRQFVFWVTLVALQRALLGRTIGWGQAERIGVRRRQRNVDLAMSSGG